MQFQLTIDCDNAAFEDGNCPREIARIMREAARRINSYDGPPVDFLNLLDDFKLQDVNGNSVGWCSMQAIGEDDEDE